MYILFLKMTLMRNKNYSIVLAEILYKLVSQYKCLDGNRRMPCGYIRRANEEVYNAYSNGHGHKNKETAMAMPYSI